MKPGDIIVELADRQVRKAYQLRNAVADTTPNTSVSVKVFRTGEFEELSVDGGRLEDQIASKVARKADATSEQLGVAVQPLTDPIRSQLGLSSEDRGLGVSRSSRRTGSDMWHTASQRFGAIRCGLLAVLIGLMATQASCRYRPRRHVGPAVTHKHTTVVDNSIADTDFIRNGASYLIHVDQ